MTILFWISVFLLVYPLILYPLCLMLMQRISPFFAPQPTANHEELPFVSILLSVFNEEDVIEEKIENFLALDYPQDKLELLIISDQSTDRTEECILHHAPLGSAMAQRIRLLRQEERAGKTKALNRAALEARGDIFFFTDADSMLHVDALRRIVAPFSNTHVGLVSGRSVYKDEHGQESTGSAYRRYEEWLKEYEGQLHGIAGADGAIYAMRKELYQALPDKIINDLVHPIQAVLAGKKALAMPSALVSEPAEDDANAFARQTRIMAQSWHVFFCYALPLAQAKHWGFLWQFFSHKILRWLTLVWLFLLAISAFFATGVWPALGLLGLGALLVVAALGEKAKTMGRICRLFLVQGAAGLYGLIRLLKGEAFVTWNPKGK